MRLAFLILAAMALGFAQEGWEVTGVVTYGGKPLKGAWVGANGPTRLAAVKTDAQGRYTAKGAVPGVYEVSADPDEDFFEPVSHTLTLAAGAHLKLDLAIPAGAVISGRLLDRDKRPVPGIMIEALVKTGTFFGVSYQESGETGTNDLGEYRIAHLRAGQYVIAAVPRPPKLENGTGPALERATAYPQMTFYPGTPRLDDAAVLELRPGQELSALNIEYEKLPAYCVKFQTDGVFPKATPNLELFPTVQGLTTSADGTTANNGAHRICGLTAGDYRLKFLNAGPGDTKFYHVQNYLSVPLIIGKENVDLGVLSVTPPAELRGTASLEGARSDDLIPPGIRVGLIAPDDRVLSGDDKRFAPVAPDGSFTLPRVFAADYAVRLGGLPSAYYVIDVTQQGRSVRNGGLRAGNGDLRVKIGVDGPVLGGRVLTEDAAPVPDATVVLVPRSGGRPWTAQSDQNGQYRFSVGIAPGDYRIVAVVDLPALRREDTALLTRIAAQGTELTLNPRDAKALDLNLLRYVP